MMPSFQVNAKGELSSNNLVLPSILFIIYHDNNEAK